MGSTWQTMSALVFTVGNEHRGKMVTNPAPAPDCSLHLKLDENPAVGRSAPTRPGSSKRMLAAAVDGESAVAAA